MKKMKLKNVLRGSFVMVMMALVFGFVTSCSNDDDDNIPGTNKSHKVVFKRKHLREAILRSLFTESTEILPLQRV